MRRLLNSPVKSLLSVSAILVLIVFLITGFWEFISSNVFPNTRFGLYKRDFWENFLVEMHGIAFELSIIGVLLIWLDSRRNKNSVISRLKEDLDDYAMLDFPEVNVKKLGHIKRLNEHGVKNISVQNLILNGLKLKGIHIESSKLIGLKVVSGDVVASTFCDTQMRSSNFEGCTVKETSFKSCNLLKSKFINAKCRGVTFSGSCLERADFTGSDLQSATFSQCNIRGAKFEGANLKHASFVTAQFINVAELAKASNLDYIKISDEILEELKRLREDMKYQLKRAGHEGIEPSHSRSC